MNIEELPAFLEQYNRRVHKQGQDFRTHFVSVSSSAMYNTPFCLSYSTEWDGDKDVHGAPTFAALIEKMKKDIDSSPLTT